MPCVILNVGNTGKFVTRLRHQRSSLCVCMCAEMCVYYIKPKFVLESAI